MKKLARLKWVEENFGPEFVLPYRACTTWTQVVKAIREFESAGHTWGLRTDTRDGKTQGFLLPFQLRGTVDGAKQIFEETGGKLTYIISHNILSYVCNAVAVPIDQEYIFFEWSCHPTRSQREMYEDPELIREVVVGPFPSSHGHQLLLCGRELGPLIRGLTPESNLAVDLRLSTIYHLLVGRSDVDEVTFSVRAPDKKVVIW